MNKPLSTATDRSILGVDIGGSKISVCVGSVRGEILASERFSTLPPEEACDRIAELARGLIVDRSLFEVVGLSAPGPLSSREGCFLNPPNMPGWHGFPIRSALERRLDLKVRLMNDANAAALAEWRYGAGRDTQTMIFYTMSTGMGAGLIVGGRLHEGLDDLAGEVGHLAVSSDGPVGFGRRGSLEGFCSGPGLSQLAVMKLTQVRHEEGDSLLLHLGKDYRLIGAEDVGRAAREGDVVALDVFHEVGLKLGQFSALMVDILNPEAIVVGTIGRLYADLILAPARKEIDRLSHPAAARRVRLLPAALGPLAGDLAAICAALPEEGI